MFSFTQKYLLGLAFVGFVVTVGGELSLNSSDSSYNDNVAMRHRRAAPKAKAKPAKAHVGPGPMILGNDNRAQWLEEHNKIRSDSAGYLHHPQPTAAGMMRMYWNVFLEASALAWAWQCCNDWKHGQDKSVVETRLFKKNMGVYGSFIGQNIQYFTGPRMKPKEIMGLYASETKGLKYSGKTASCPGNNCGHYTAITWNETYLVGCGYALCPKGSKFGITSVCNFLPGGNSRGNAAPYNPGTPGSECARFTKFAPFTKSNAAGKLCQPADPCSAVKDCKVSDTTNCLCSNADYNTKLKEIMGKKVSGASKFLSSSTAVSSGLLLPLVVFLLGKGLQRLFHSGLL